MSNSSRLKRITTRAKQIYKRGGTWKGALKKAGAELRGSGSGSRKKRKSGSRKKKRVGVVWPSGVGSMPVVSGNGTIAGHLSTAKRLIAEKIGDKERQKFTATTKVNKRKIQREISKLKRQYRSLK